LKRFAKIGFIKKNKESQDSHLKAKEFSSNALKKFEGVN
jgi:hypothetical protein